MMKGSRAQLDLNGEILKDNEYAGKAETKGG